MDGVETTQALFTRHTRTTGISPAIFTYPSPAILLSLGVLFGSFSAASCLATTLNVPSEYPTIQAAVDAAADGDSIVAAAGSYTELWIRIAGKKLLIVGAGRDATFLSSNPLRSVSTFAASRTSP